MARSTAVPSTTITEEIYSYEVFPSSNLIRVSIISGVLGAGAMKLDPALDDVTFTSVDIMEDVCEELLAESPSWAMGKSANYFKEEDLWNALDARAAGTSIEAHKAATV